MRVERIQGAYVPAPSAAGPARTACSASTASGSRRTWSSATSSRPAPNELWCSDLKQIPTGEGVLHLASVLDFFSRRIVGWAMGPVADTHSSPTRCGWLSCGAGQAQGWSSTPVAGAGRIQAVVGSPRSRGVGMGNPKRRRSDRAGRPAMRSPGRPPGWRREHRQRFWAAVTRGATSEAAGVEAGVSPAVGVRWFREGGGMPSVTRRRCRDAFCRSRSGRRSRCCAPAGVGFGRSRASSAARRRRCPGSCAGTPRPVVGVSSTERQLRSGMRTGGRAGPSRPSWR